jgi:hypothetical protein
MLARLRLARGEDCGGVGTVGRGRTRGTASAPGADAARDCGGAGGGAAAPGQGGRGGARLAQSYALPFCQVHVHLAAGKCSVGALALLDSLRAVAEAKNWQDELLQVTALQALAHRAQGELETALRRLEEALALAEPGGFIRLFVDEGAPMAELLGVAAAQGMMPEYVGRLLAAFPAVALPTP